METRCVLSAVRTESLNNIYMSVGVKGLSTTAAATTTTTFNVTQ
jgi:hypothetical protein